MPPSARALLAALLVVVCGAIIGVAGFAFEQAHADWRPHATRTATGWRVTQPVLGVNGPALAGGHLAWQAGPYTIVMDLRSGKTKLVGAAADAQSVEPPAVSSAAAVWVELSGEPHQRTVVYSYDFASRRRQLPVGATDGRRLEHVAGRGRRDGVLAEHRRRRELGDRAPTSAAAASACWPRATASGRSCSPTARSSPGRARRARRRRSR